MHRLVLEGPDHLQAGPVADVRQPGVPVAPEVALQDEPVLRAIEGGAPLLQLEDPFGRPLIRTVRGAGYVVDPT